MPVGSRRRHALAGPWLFLLPLQGGCSGPQSAFASAGTEAATIATLFWIMTIGATAIWLFVVGLSLYAVIARRRITDRAGIHLVIWGGCVFPTVVLAALLSYGLSLMPPLRAPATGPTIAVSAERFWWRISYGVEGRPGVGRELPQGGVQSANELWLPLGARSEILLGSPDVVHSFWVPALAGKTDAIPGRVNRLALEPTKRGVFRGICAEFCGESHAQMNFAVVVVSREAFEAHLRRLRRPAAVTEHEGLDLFLANGCGACHTVRGTAADGHVGPDLTHVASRRSIAAGVLPTTVDNIARFIRSPEHVKDAVAMPAFGMLPEEDIRSIAEWLGRLR